MYPVVWFSTTLSTWSGTSAAKNEKDFDFGSMSIGKKLRDKKVKDLPTPGQYIKQDQL